MAEIIHRLIDTNGIRLHVAEAGPKEGPCVIMCHGFPESWYSWRHQLHALGDAGYHAVAPDMRGFRSSSRPLDPAKYTQPKLVGDMVGLLAALPHESAVIAGHDWGAPVAWNAALMRPDLFPAVIALSVPYYGARTTFAYDHSIPPSQAMRHATGGGFHYQLYFNEVGRVERDLERDVRRWLAGFFFTASGDAPPEEIKLAQLVRGDRLEAGFASALNYYRAADATWEEMAPYRGASVTVPACFVAGDRDLVILMNDEIYQGMPKQVPQLRTNLLLPGCGHWTQQERPEETTRAMLEFLETTAVDSSGRRK